jgi:hypothetical protein
MKKQVLLTTGILISGLISAQVAKTYNGKIPAHIANVAIKKTPPVYQEHINIVPNGPQKQVASNKKTAVFTTNVIGTTYYDLQTNSSVADRIVVNTDGSIGACWTMETTPNDNTYPTRGTGYAYYNGSTWSAAPTVRVENSRVGWGNIAHSRTGKELILSHDGSVSKLKLASRAAKGTGTWAESTTAVPSATTGGNFWPRMVTSNPSGGDTIYSVSLTYPVSQGGALWQGLDGAVVFSRSTDAGATWDITNQVPTGLDATKYLGFGGDGYAIAARGATVAIVAGDSDKDLTMVKSTDGGVTWTPTVVVNCPIDKWDHTTTTSDINSDAVADTLETNDGSYSIALDNNGKVFVAYGGMRVLQDAVSATGGYSYFPGTDGLYLWDETMATDAGVLTAAIEDLYQQGTIYFPSPANSGDLTFGRWGCSLTSMPSLAIDASNNIYLSYSSVVDSLMSFVNQTKLVRHVYVIKSMDGGATWTDPCNIVGKPNDLIYEAVFASMAKYVDGNVHLIYQRDYAPGNGIPGTASSPNPDETENAGGNNDIVYFKFPVSEIGLCNVDVSVKEMSSSIATLNFYPNPASTNGTIEVVLNENAKMDVVVLNSVGQTVYSTSVAGNAGSNKVDVNLNNLSSGLYFYQVRIANAKAVTKKFVIEK